MMSSPLLLDGQDLGLLGGLVVLGAGVDLELGVHRPARGPLGSMPSPRSR